MLEKKKLFVLSHVMIYIIFLYLQYFIIFFFENKMHLNAENNEIWMKSYNNYVKINFLYKK